MTAQEKGQQTRQANRQKRKDQQDRRAQELALMRSRLVQVIDNQNVSDSEALKAIDLLWNISEKTRYY